MMNIRKIEKRDEEEVIEMMRVFYASPAVLSNASEEIFRNDIKNCVSSSPYIEGFIFEENNSVMGYAMIAKSFSTEFGMPCVWIEDIYIKENFRGLGIGSKFFDFIEKTFQGYVVRLEVEEENTKAYNLYKKCGYEILPYLQMKKIIK